MTFDLSLSSSKRNTPKTQVIKERKKEMIPIILCLCALICSFIHLVVKKEWNKKVEIILSYIIFFNIGIMGLLGFYAHTAISYETATLIGWPPGNPFQQEVAAANLAFGILGIMAFSYRSTFWLATIIGQCIFLLGALVVHIVDYLQRGNTAPENFGLFVWTDDLVMPLIYLALLYYYMREYPHKESV